jgi:hypothetical protein
VGDVDVEFLLGERGLLELRIKVVELLVGGLQVAMGYGQGMIGLLQLLVDRLLTVRSSFEGLILLGELTCAFVGEVVMLTMIPIEPKEDKDEHNEEQRYEENKGQRD